jgi:hypothetical protein
LILGFGNLQGLAFMVALSGSLISSLICTRMMMKGTKATGIKKHLDQLYWIMILFFLAWILCNVGCAGASTITGRSLRGF